MIIALTGALCSGKSSVAKYLADTFGFKIVSIYQAFANKMQLDDGKHTHDQIVYEFFSGKRVDR